jgi:hypothetical protein
MKTLTYLDIGFCNDNTHDPNFCCVIKYKLEGTMYMDCYNFVYNDTELGKIYLDKSLQWRSAFSRATRIEHFIYSNNNNNRNIDI